MIKTKIAFIILVTLALIIFPYYILVFTIDSDFLYSVIPGWKTTIIPARLISNLIKFLILVMVGFYYWKLSKTINELNLKHFIIHAGLTIPAVVIAKLNLYQFFTFNLHDPNFFLSQIRKVVYINMFVNVLFLAGQILFWIYYIKLKKTKIIIK